MSPARRPRRRPVRKGGAKRAATPLKLVVRLLAAIALVVVLAVGWVAWSYRGPGPAAPEGEVTSVVLERGSGLIQIAETLKDAGVIGSPRLFVTAAKITGAARSLKAGEYEFASRASMARVLWDIREGKVVRHLVAVPEGWTSDMATDAVNAQPVLTGLALSPPEGSILPDTYLVQRGEDRQAVIQRMRAAHDKVMDELWAGRAPDLPFSTRAEAVTLASIVEKETAQPAERPRVAAVYVNRLRLGMRMDSDPTVIYGISKGRPLGRGITAAELSNPTPYNTYRMTGLPPTPIANPGKDSLAAVLNPPKTDEIFFVANGSGGHSFSKTYEEHQRNVARWRQFERAQIAKAAAGTGN